MEMRVACWLWVACQCVTFSLGTATGSVIDRQVESERLVERKVRDDRYHYESDEIRLWFNDSTTRATPSEIARGRLRDRGCAPTEESDQRFVPKRSRNWEKESVQESSTENLRRKWNLNGVIGSAFARGYDGRALDVGTGVIGEKKLEQCDFEFLEITANSGNLDQNRCCIVDGSPVPSMSRVVDLTNVRNSSIRRVNLLWTFDGKSDVIDAHVVLSAYDNTENSDASIRQKASTMTTEEIFKDSLKLPKGPTSRHVENYALYCNESSENKNEWAKYKEIVKSLREDIAKLISKDRSTSFQSALRAGEKLVERSNLTGYTETEFLVDDVVTNIRIVIVGNLSQAILEIPTAPDIDATDTLGLLLSLTRTADATGVRFDARNSPAGRWLLKLRGVENSNYLVAVLSTKGLANRVEGNRRSDVLDGVFSPDDSHNTRITLEESFAGEKGYVERIVPSLGNNYDGFAIPDLHSIEVRDVENISDLGGIDEVARGRKEVPPSNAETGEYLSRSSSTIDEISMTDAQAATDQERIGKLVRVFAPTNNQNSSNLVESSSQSTNVSDEIRLYFDSPTSHRSAKSIGTGDGTATWDNVNPSKKSIAADRTVSARVVVGASAQASANAGASELEDLAKITTSDISTKRFLFVELSSNTDLIVNPGTYARVIFDVTNNHALSIRHYFQARSSTFNVANLQPTTTWIDSGQTAKVAVDVIVPPGISEDTMNTVTLRVQGIDIIEKSAQQYVKSSTTTLLDTEKPTLSYSFNNNCAGRLDSSRCANTQWSVEITAQDSGTGLLRVSSTPRGIYPKTEFISGTKNEVKFYYSSTCCYTTVEITASDLLGNYNSRHIDVTAWDNLSQGEIAAIVVGVFFIIVLILLIVLITLYCVRKRQSLDLPYSQRYGSRPATRNERERTSF